jgi:hypothetical protein
LLLNYGQLETLMARIHGASAKAQTGALRARIRHLRRLGLPLGISPGTGNPVAYGKKQIYELAFCLELEQCGVDPRLAVGLLKAHREYVLNAYAKAEAAVQKNEGYYFWLKGEFMAVRWTKETKKFPGLPQMQAGPASLLERALETSKRMIVFSLTTIAAEALQAENEERNGVDP